MHKSLVENLFHKIEPNIPNTRVLNLLGKHCGNITIAALSMLELLQEEHKATRSELETASHDASLLFH